MYAKVTFRQGLPDNAHTVVASFGDPSGRLDRDFWARDIECRNLTASDTITGRNMVVREAIRSEDFVSGFIGRGFRILGDGSAEMRSLVLHDSLEVPELRYNRITAVGGQLWVTSAGTVRSVTDNGNGTWTLVFKLEEGEVHEFDKDDILRAVFHTPTGFQTGIYRVTEYLDTSSVRVSIVEGCQPQAAMTVVRTGNYTDPDRQNSIYLDGYHGYERILKGVDTPDFEADQIIYQAGVLDGLTTEAFGPLEGIGVYCGNLYAAGSLRVKVNGVSSDVGTQFEVTAEGISALVTKTETIDGKVVVMENELTVTAEGLHQVTTKTETIDSKVTTLESELSNTAEELMSVKKTTTEIDGKVTTMESTIQQLSDKITLQITKDDLYKVGIEIDGNDMGVHVTADMFDVSASTSGVKLLEASSDGNRVTLRNVDITEGFTLGYFYANGRGLAWNGEDGSIVGLGQAMPAEAGLGDVIAYLKASSGTALWVQGATNMPGVLLCAYVSNTTAYKRWGYYTLGTVSRVFSSGEQGGPIFRCKHNIGHTNYSAFAMARTTSDRGWWKYNALVLDCTTTYVDVIIVDIGNENEMNEGAFELLLVGSNA
ncbi:hypothetical protein [Millionella massiliensis]|uniref:hypothetical protein n=1 Tax=Millionella massiliensis TaxID=1871023 RepID=UPI0008D910EB|nr:hypothetical protein [Millionella massiliensis]